MGKRELIALLNLSSWCLMMVERLFLAVPRDCLHLVIVVFPDHTHLLFFRLYDGSDLNTYPLMRWYGPDALAVCLANRGLPVGLFAPVFSFIYC